MASVRMRHALLVSLFAGGLDVVVACSSSDRPPGATSSSSSAGGPTTEDGGDAEADADRALDASVDGPVFTDDGSCLDDRPSPKMDAGDAAPTCPAGSCAAHCASIVSSYKLGVAQTAVACIRALPDCSDLLNVHLCVDQAVGESCKDTTSTGYCTPLVATCDPNAGRPGSLIDEPGCEAIANALGTSGRSTFSSCIESKVAMGTCPNDVHLCTDALRE